MNHPLKNQGSTCENGYKARIYYGKRIPVKEILKKSQIMII